jgi:hypothetical protein
MASIPPVVRHMLVCDNVTRSGDDRPKLDVLGVVHTIRARPGQTFPLTHPGLCVYLVLTGGVGVGRIQLRVSEADPGAPLFGSPVHTVTHPVDRHELSGLVLRVGPCVFPRPGLYWVEFHHDGIELGRESVVVR